MLPKNPRSEGFTELIKNSPILTPPEKQYLVEQIPNLKPLQKLKTKQNLMMNTTPEVILEFRRMKANFIKAESLEKKNSKPTFFQPKNKPTLLQFYSILQNPRYTGTATALTSPNKPFRDIESLSQVTSIEDIYLLTPRVVDFSINENSDQQMFNFLSRVKTQLDATPQLSHKRSYLLLLMKSSLFKAYIRTGIAALQHSEIQPRTSVLNTLQKIDHTFLNRSQFLRAGSICTTIRTACFL